VINGAPWTSYLPQRPQDFAFIARFIARRWGKWLAALELWNEPNLFTAVSPEEQVAAYTAMVRGAYPAIKRVAPRLPVLAGSLGLTDVWFLRQMYAHGARGYFEGLSVHPYGR
jgi:acyl-homoserine lactone acylase PvdQ